jgi:hypothetical protein
VLVLVGCLLAGLASTALAPIPVHAAAPTAPAITATPGTPQTGGAAPVGSAVTLTGQGFGASEVVTLSLNGQALTTTPSPLVSAADSTFSGTFVVPSLPLRAYLLVAQGLTSGARAGLTFWLRAQSENVFSPASSNATYQISDPDPREPGMAYLRITNTGDTNLVNPKIVTDSLDGQEPILDTSSVQSIVNGLFAANPGATTAAQKAYVIWHWMVDTTYHSSDAQLPDDTPQLDATGILNNYGYMKCWNHSRFMMDLFQAAGYQTRAWNMSGHVVPEVFYGGAWHEYDGDIQRIYVASDGTTVLGQQDLQTDTLPLFQMSDGRGWSKYYNWFRRSVGSIANYYATTGDNAPFTKNTFPPASHSMGITLRKNETLMENWSNVGKYHDNYLHTAPPCTRTEISPTRRISPRPATRTGSTARRT